MVEGAHICPLAADWNRQCSKVGNVGNPRYFGLRRSFPSATRDRRAENPLRWPSYRRMMGGNILAHGVYIRTMIRKPMRALAIRAFLPIALLVAGCGSDTTKDPRPAILNAERANSGTESVYVGRQVRKPGRYTWTNGMSALDAVALAGGSDDFARGGRVEVIHRDGTKESCPLKRIRSTKARPVPLKPGDRVLVQGTIP